MQLLKDLQIKLIYKNLEVGDFILSDDVCVERKIVSDFVNSLLDRRLFTQAIEIKRNFDKPLFILEGSIDELVERSLKQASLWNEVKDRLHDSALGLSGGQQQRLCIARALAMEPNILLMDEPCSALDPISTAHIEDLMYELKQRYTIVIVTHNMQQAARVSDYTAFMEMGNLIEFGETDQIFTRPGEQRTEDYVTGRFG